MGVVYRAQQISLDRQVALKVLPLAALLDQKQIARFRNEAQAAAQLHHPNIVPVFAVGCERGVHYYAMQYIEGRALDRVVQELLSWAETQGGATTSRTQNASTFNAANLSTCDVFSTVASQQDGDYFRGVAQLGIQAARALDHAHQYGIVHRDVKPSNLLLDKQGKLWVTDFGLARFHADTGVTRTGDVVGTARYMSPEQAAGGSRLVDQRSDVYSLGITLYELLTLQPAFEGVDRQEFLSRIERDEPTAPRKIQPSIPVDLETIVLKAISKAPEHRYATASQFADDLQRFLDNKPTLARRPTLADRAAKWARRHRPLVGTALGVLLMALVGLAVSTILITREKSRTEAAFKTAQAHLRQARDIIDRFGLNYTERLSQLPGTEELRRDVLQDTLTYYQHFIMQSAEDPSLRGDLAVTHFKAGQLIEQFGLAEEALDSYEKAKSEFAQLAVDDPTDVSHRRNLALCYNNIALLDNGRGHRNAARKAFDKAIQIQQELVAEEPAQGQYQSDLALSYANLALLEERTGAEAEAETSFQLAIDMQRRLVEKYPGQADYQRDLSISYNNLSYYHRKLDPQKAEEVSKQAIELQKELVEAYPDKLEYQRNLALSHNNRGALLSHLGEMKEAQAAHLAAVDIQKQLVQAAPAVVRHRSDLAISHNNLGMAYSKSDDPAKAEHSFVEALRTLSALSANDTDNLLYRSSLGGSYNNLAMALERLNRLDEANGAYELAIEHQRAALESAPHEPRFRKFLDNHYQNYRRSLLAAGRYDDAARIASDLEQLASDSPSQQ